MAVPLQPIKTFGDGKEGGWRNMLILGDNVQAMKTLLRWKEEDGSIGAGRGKACPCPTNGATHARIGSGATRHPCIRVAFVDGL